MTPEAFYYDTERGYGHIPDGKEEPSNHVFDRSLGTYQGSGQFGPGGENIVQIHGNKHVFSLRASRVRVEVDVDPKTGIGRVPLTDDTDLIVDTRRAAK